MEEFLSVALAYPTIVLTVPLVLATFYWLTVILGVADVDVLGGALGKAEGALDAAAGKAEGVLEAAAGKASSLLDAAAGKTEGVLDAAAAKVEGGAEAAPEGSLTALLSALRLRRAPITVVLSLLLLFAWVLTFVGMRQLAPVVALPAWLVGSLVLIAALAVSWPITALVTFPMGDAYQTRPAITHAQLVGASVTVTTSRVDGRFGEAELRGSGPELVLQVRCGAPNSLEKGSEALIVAWDADREAFDVEPYDALVAPRADEKRRG